LGFSTFTRYDNILEAIGGNVKTNLTFDKMKYIAVNYRETRNNIVTYEMKGTTDRIDGISYVLATEAEQRKVQGWLRGSWTLKINLLMNACSKKLFSNAHILSCCGYSVMNKESLSCSSNPEIP
jgi:anionic cell wall polymer biosynthesis LytR-Cps2A-Psr (LCP) family protein